jgi:hypothetical protein
MRFLTRSATMLAAGALLLTAGSGLAVSTASAASQVLAPQSANSSAVGNLACADASGDWTDCTLTLSQTVAPGSTVEISLPAADASNLVCENNPGVSGAYCGTAPDTVEYQLPQGGTPGDQLDFGDYGASTSPSAQGMTVTSLPANS